jgi:hypothetical protein
MSRPPRNGYTINSDAELSSLDTSLVPANTPLINFDRKCWQVYIPETSEIGVPQVIPYTASTPESYSYFNTSYALDKLNDGTGEACMPYTLLPFFRVITTFPEAKLLTSFLLTNGQFNGNFNKPEQVDVYRGSAVEPTSLVGTFIVSNYATTEYFITEEFSPSTTYLFVFYRGSQTTISIRELELKCEATLIVTPATWEPIPQNQIDAYDLTSITISTDTYSLDLAGATQYISITLATNTTLTILNAGKYTKYFIELIPNGHIIKNFTDIFALPKQYSLATFLTAYFGKQVLELQYVNKLYANIDYSDNVNKTGAVAYAEKIGWEAPFSEALYLAFASSTTAYTGAGISTIGNTVGTPTISKARLLLSGGRLEATKTSAFDLNETDFTISFFSAKTSVGEYGCIVGSHKASSIGFYVGVAADSTLFAIFGSNVLSCALPDDLFEHSVVINRIGRVYKIFIDGVLSAHLKAANNFNNNSTEPLCIGSLKNSVGTAAWTSQSWQGYLIQQLVFPFLLMTFRLKTPQRRTQYYFSNLM